MKFVGCQQHGKKTTMTADEIQTMFRAYGALKTMDPNDPQFNDLANIYSNLASQYVNEYFVRLSIQKKMTLQNALHVLMNTCMQATGLELEYHPANATDDEIKERAEIRKQALDTIVDELKKH